MPAERRGAKRGSRGIPERNPHMRPCFVPLTHDNRLSAKDVMGDRNELVERRDKFYDYMVEEFPELEQGQTAARRAEMGLDDPILLLFLQCQPVPVLLGPDSVHHVHGGPVHPQRDGGGHGQATMCGWPKAKDCMAARPAQRSGTHRDGAGPPHRGSAHRRAGGGEDLRHQRQPHRYLPCSGAAAAHMHMTPSWLIVLCSVRASRVMPPFCTCKTHNGMI